MHYWHDQFVAQALVISFGVIMRDESSQSIARRGLAKENQFVKAFGFQRSEKSFQVRIQIGASRGQLYWLHALVTQEVPKRLTERRIPVHDQVLLVLEKTVLVVGQLASHRFHPRFIRIGGAACEVDAACFQLHDKKQIERRQPTLCPDFHCSEVNRGHHVPVRLQECFP